MSILQLDLEFVLLLSIEIRSLILEMHILVSLMHDCWCVVKIHETLLALIVVELVV